MIAYNGKKEDFNRLPKYDYVRYLDFSTQDNDIYRFLDITKTNAKFGMMHEYIKVITHKTSLQISLLNILVETIKVIFHDIHWCCVIDTDEFICIKDGSSDLKNFFADNFPPDQFAYSIGMNFYDDNDLIYYDDRPCMERFTRPCKSYQMDWSDLSVTKIILNLRHPSMINGFTCMIDSAHTCKRCDWMAHHFDFNMIELRHFWSKTLEEWISKFNTNIDREYCTRFKNEMFLKFFFYVGENSITDEKMRAIPELLKKYNIKYDPTIEDCPEFVEAYKKANNIL